MAIFTKIEKLQELFKDSIDGELVEQTVTPLLPPGENFGSVMYKVDFKVQKPNTKEEEEYHAVAKCTPLNKVTQEMFNTQVTFKSEIAWYTTVIPTLKNFQKNSGRGVVIDYFQKFYGSRISLDPNSNVVDEHGVILTENLKSLGYRNVDRHIGFSLKESKAILKAMASFHAVPIAIKLQNKPLFEKNIKPFLPNLQMPEEPKDVENPFLELYNLVCAIEAVAPYAERCMNSLKNNAPFVNDREVSEPWGSICHNDFWINNIMVTDGVDPKVMILDLQVPCYGSIANDLVFFLSTSVSLEVIRDNMDKLFQFYWDEFVKNLEDLNVDTSLFPYDGFLKELNEAGTHSQFSHSIFHTYIIFTEKGTTSFDSSDADFKMEDMMKQKTTLTEKHEEKYNWLVPEYARRNWI